MKAVIKIQNLKCGGCANTISNGLKTMAAVQDIYVAVEERTVTFDYGSPEALAAVKSKLKSLGYPEQGEDNTLGSKAKSFFSCAVGKMN